MQLVLFYRTGLFIPGLFRQNVDDGGGASLHERQLDHVDELSLALAVEEEIDAAFASKKPHQPRAVIIHAEPDTWLLLVVLSHVVADGWSVQIFQRELMTGYEAYLRGEGNPLPEPRAQYGDFVTAQHQQIISGRLDREAAYWLRQWNELGDECIRHHEVPFARHDPAPPVIRRLTRTMSDAESAAVLLTARRLRTTPYMLFRTAFTIVLHGYTGKQGIALWANFANRERNPEDMFGCCANTYLVTTAIMPGSSWVSLCRRVGDELFEAQVHQAFPLVALWRYTGRNLAVKCDTRINFDYVKVPRTLVPSALEPVVVPGGRRWMDLDLRLRLEHNRVVLHATYNSSRYSDAGITDMLASVCRVISRCVGDEAVTVQSCAALVR